jgi:FKBP-type peptidyl-prolyl cis-trans isomerase
MRIRATWVFNLPLLALALVIALLAMAGCDKGTPTASTTTSAATPGVENSGDAPLTSLKIEDIKVGNGKTVADHDRVIVKYTGTLKNGTVFDSNDKPDGKPFPFMVGAGSVIKGWDQGIIGMKVGGERKLSIPSELAYGSQAQGEKIPANSDLFFTIKLISVTKKDEMDTVVTEDKKKGTGPELKAGDTAYITYTLVGDDGTMDDDSYKTKPYKMKVGGGKVLPAIDAGIRGMKAGGERVLTIPAMYGPKGPSFMGQNSFTADITLTKIER